MTPRPLFVDIEPVRGRLAGTGRWRVRHGRDTLGVGRGILGPHGEAESYARQWHHAVHREQPLTIRFHDHDRCAWCDEDTVNV